MESSWKALVNCEVNLILTWSENRVIVYTFVANQDATFVITKTTFYVPAATLWTQDNAKLLQQLESSFKRVIKWNKCLLKPELLAQNQNLNHLVESSKFSWSKQTFCFTNWGWCTSKQYKQ